MQKKPNNADQKIAWLGAAAQCAIVLAITLNLLKNQELDFVIGFLTGFSIAGNSVFLYTFCRQRQDIKS